VLFRQVRVGRNGRCFVFYKFRTLYADARERFPELYRYDYTPEELEKLPVKVRNDPRVTRVGRWLRVSTIDELPNFWNLLKGDIALVGPRADVPDMLRNYRPDEMIKFSVKPGITGLAQIRGRGRLRFHEMNAHDVEYVRNRSFWLDCKIVAHTVMLVIRFDGTF
jgi:lipopolysaccharide/colanic/teichoic acid biosynthesis glycosyltransferase